jgi:cytochrome c oxidase subunit 4
MVDEQSQSPEEPVEEVVGEAAEAPKEAADELRHEAEKLEHTPIVEAFEAGKESLVEAIESVPASPETREEAHAPLHGDTTEILGITIPYPVYTVVFGILAVLTLLEVLVGTSGEGFLRIPLLVAIAVVKAALVVLYYMHLKSDSVAYRWALVIPLFIAIAAMFWLLIVPPVAY